MHPVTEHTKSSIEATQEVWPAMPKHRKRFYTREEDFLGDYESTAFAAAKFLRWDWNPNASWDDEVRDQNEHLCESGKLEHLAFDCAFIDEDGGRFVSVQIHLKSSQRQVIVAVTRVGNLLVAEKIGDEETP